MTTMRLLPILTVILLMCGCIPKNDTGLTAEATSLYEKTMEMTRCYTDSMLRSNDSTTLLRLAKEYEENLTKLNFQYPAETDVEMNEGQNDTLQKENIRFLEVRDSMLYLFAHRPAPVDSIAQDSIPE